MDVLAGHLHIQLHPLHTHRHRDISALLSVQNEAIHTGMCMYMRRVYVCVCVDISLSLSLRHRLIMVS